MAFPDIGEIEDAIVHQLSLRPGLKASFSAGSDEMLRRKPFKMPASIVMFEASEWDEPDIIGAPTHQMGRLRWLVWVVAESLRGPREGRLGEYGAYAAIAEVMNALVGWEPIFGFPMYHLSTEIFDFGDPSRTLYVCRFEHEAELTGN